MIEKNVLAAWWPREQKTREDYQRSSLFASRCEEVGIQSQHPFFFLKDYCYSYDNSLNHLCRLMKVRFSFLHVI